MTRIVADTNIYISALNFASAPDEVLALGRAGTIDVFISPTILAEIEGVLRSKFRWSAPRLRAASRAILGFALMIRPKETVNVVREDEPDNRILEYGLAAKADFIVTGDRHLLRLGRFRGILIATPRQFLDAETRRR